ncbi:6-phospho-3-hexuloisomerase [Candidatus Aerophobetes bacterium]|uniref:6-phospho-3-hexuloisomerase n=1 Tax=Aerophobetes bacterium TaxID=2030807 RepID=A0A662DD76_UNCAE|nr:MAG: 6-phospho-3-hexuloisomerase [Candidatus Aerophobetes bacterium]
MLESAKSKSVDEERIDINDHIKRILSEINRVLSSLSEDDAAGFIQMILSSKRVFVGGAGRSGIVIRAFAMRLMQLGFTAYVVGETTTPAIRAGDLLVIISGSGETRCSHDILMTAKKAGAYTYLITANESSPMGKLADGKIAISGPTKLSPGKIESKQVAGSLFEQGAFIFLEGVISAIVKKLKISAEDIMLRHANLE